MDIPSECASVSESPVVWTVKSVSTNVGDWHSVSEKKEKKVLPKCYAV